MKVSKKHIGTRVTVVARPGSLDAGDELAGTVTAVSRYEFGIEAGYGHTSLLSRDEWEVTVENRGYNSLVGDPK